MKHPVSRSQRRHNRETARDRRRANMLTWYGYRNKMHDVTENKMWLQGGKQCVGHGNRCSCHIEKSSGKRKRRSALKRTVLSMRTKRYWAQ